METASNLETFLLAVLADLETFLVAEVPDLANFWMDAISATMELIMFIFGL